MICAMRDRELSTSPVSYQVAKHVVRNVAGRIANSPGRAMGKYHRRFAHPQCVLHSPYRHVRQIDKHSQPIQLFHYCFAKRR